MRLPSFGFNRKIAGCVFSIRFYPMLLAVGIYWEDDPLSLYLMVPFTMLSIQRDREYQGNGRDWCWFLLRFEIGKQDIRLDVDLHGWMIGMKMIQTNDYSFHVGPFDLECEYGKLYASDVLMRPTLRLFSKADPAD